MTVTNTRGKLASLRPANTTQAQMYVVPAGTEIDGVLRVMNPSAIERLYQVAHCDPGHGDNVADSDDYIAKSIPIPPYKVHEYSIHAGPTETIRVQSSIADTIVFHLSGNKKVTS